MSASSVAPVVSQKSRKRPARFVVVYRNRILFEHESMSGAFGWRDGFGCGVVLERLTTPRKAVRP